MSFVFCIKYVIVDIVEVFCYLLGVGEGFWVCFLFVVNGEVIVDLVKFFVSLDLLFF